MDDEVHSSSDVVGIAVLRDRFQGLSERLGLDPGLFELLDTHYANPTRCYHNWQHIFECLGELDAIALHLSDPIAVELALWFHDVIYVPGNKRNEIESGRIAYEAISPADAALAVKVQAFIAETDYSRQGKLIDTDLDYLKDIDFVAFAKPFESFWRDVQRLRRENAEANSNHSATARRIKFYQNVLNGDFELFRTPLFRSRCLAPALSNLRRGIALLQEGGRDG